MTSYLKKVEKICSEDREFVREELAWLAEWLSERYPILDYTDLRKFISEMLSISV